MQLLTLLLLFSISDFGFRSTQCVELDLKPITVDFWCSEQSQILLVSTFNALGYEVREHPRKDGEPLITMGRSYLSCESFDDGSIILYAVEPDCDAKSGELNLVVTFKSERAKPEEAVRNFLKWRK